MTLSDYHLSRAATEVDSGATPQLSVRDFLWWWLAQRRTYATVSMIRGDLERYNLETSPDFESTYLDAIISLQRPHAENEVKEVEEGETGGTIFANSDPTYRVSKLAAANQTVVYVSPDATLGEVVTVMLEKNFSQIPVMTGERDVKGVITWKSVGSRLALKNDSGSARKFMERARIVSSTDTIFEVIDQIVEYDHVLVRGEEGRITGIITASDLSIQFRTLSEAFLILSEIENNIRSLIEPKFTKDDLEACIDPADSNRSVNGVADLSFGEYIRLLENGKRWDKFAIPIDRKRFCAGLDNVRNIRNDVMHFDPDGIPDEDIQKLRDFSRFLQQVRAIIS